MFPEASLGQDRIRGSQRGLGNATPPSLPSPRAGRAPQPGRGRWLPRSSRGERKGRRRLAGLAAGGAGGPSRVSFESFVRDQIGIGTSCCLAFPATDTSGQLHFLRAEPCHFLLLEGFRPGLKLRSEGHPQSHLNLLDEPFTTRETQ